MSLPRKGLFLCHNMAVKPNDFQKLIWDYYRQHGRHELPWRRDITPYRIATSEVMLQQTQVSRVLKYFPAWLVRFPSWSAMAEAPLTDILSAWQGLGYNRRALNFHRLAKEVAASGLPSEPAELKKLPGIGANTAGSIAAFAFNRPVVFIETNIRRIYLHHFFAGQDDVSDAQLLPLISKTLDGTNPREWYWALMDYGSSLPKQTANPNRRSKHYAVQSRFEGSLRQLRGEVTRRLLAGPASLSDLPDDTRLPEVLEALTREGFIERRGRVVRLVG